jgi:hypothetical protein
MKKNGKTAIAAKVARESTTMAKSMQVSTQGMEDVSPMDDDNDDDNDDGGGGGGVGDSAQAASSDAVTGAMVEGKKEKDKAGSRIGLEGGNEETKVKRLGTENEGSGSGEEDDKDEEEDMKDEEHEEDEEEEEEEEEDEDPRAGLSEYEKLRLDRIQK